MTSQAAWRARGFGEPGGSGAGHVDGALVIAAEQFAALGRAHADARAEIFAFGVAADEGFRKDDQARSPGGGVRR